MSERKMSEMNMGEQENPDVEEAVQRLIAETEIELQQEVSGETAADTAEPQLLSPDEQLTAIKAAMDAGFLSLQESYDSKSTALQEAFDGKLTALQEAFDDKIAVDSHKNDLFDKMHAELTKYRDGFAEKMLDTMALDIIQLSDSMTRSSTLYKEREPGEENYRKLLRALDGVLDDLEDILYRQGIEPYTVEDENVDVRRQKIIGSVETDCEELHNKVAERTAKGYERNGKIVRPERVKIYKYIPAEDGAEE